MSRLLTLSSFVALSLGVYAGCGGKVQFLEGSGGSGGETDPGTGTGTGTGTASSTATGTETSTQTSTGTGTGTTTSTGTSTSTSTGTGVEECWQQGGDACFVCCETNFGAEMQMINELFIALCICNPGAPCQPVCASVCANPGNPPSPQCEACIDDISINQDQCILDAVDTCFADPMCAPILECWGGC